MTPINKLATTLSGKSMGHEISSLFFVNIWAFIRSLLVLRLIHTHHNQLGNGIPRIGNGCRHMSRGCILTQIYGIARHQLLLRQVLDDCSTIAVAQHVVCRSNSVTVEIWKIRLLEGASGKKMSQKSIFGVSRNSHRNSFIGISLQLQSKIFFLSYLHEPVDGEE